MQVRAPLLSLALRFTDQRPGNGTAITTLPVVVTTNDTIWFYDANTCSEGGVGAINPNESSTATLAGFAVRPFVSLSHTDTNTHPQRNAERLNGTQIATSSTPSQTATSPTGAGGGGGGSGTSTSSAGSSTGSNAATAPLVRGAGLGLGLGLLGVLGLVL